MIKLVDNLFDAATLTALGEFASSGQQLTMGPLVREFESRFARLIGRNHAVMTNSGSSANLLLAQWLADCGAFRVAVSALTWATNVMPLMQLSMEPVPVDVQPETLNIGATLPPNVDAVFATCALGWAPPLEELAEECDRRKIPLLLDCCEALGSKLDGWHLGSYGLAATYSFYAGHHICTIEGGMVVCDDDDLHDALLMMRSHGWARDVAEKRRAMLSVDGRFVFHRCGYNVRPMEIQGFLGLRGLEAWPDTAAERSCVYHRLARAQGFGIEIQDGLSECIPMAFPVVCSTREECIDRQRRFEAAGIETRPMIAGNITRQPFWPGGPVPLPGADHLHDCSFYGPLRPGLTDEQLRAYEKVLK